MTRKMKSAKIETEAHRGGSEAKRGRDEEGRRRRAELGERIAEKKADLEDAGEGEGEEGEGSAMMSKDGALRAGAGDSPFRKLAAQQPKRRMPRTPPNAKKRREIIAMNKKYEAKMAETFKRQGESEEAFGRVRSARRGRRRAGGTRSTMAR